MKALLFRWDFLSRDTRGGGGGQNNLVHANIAACWGESRPQTDHSPAHVRTCTLGSASLATLVEHFLFALLKQRSKDAEEVKEQKIVEPEFKAPEIEAGHFL